jgi:16S rRNA (adenine1518-N6/adenine1519-N6)-dimethyltransferase
MKINMNLSIFAAHVLSYLYPPKEIEESLSTIGQSPMARPEELSLNDFLKLFEMLS